MSVFDTLYQEMKWQSLDAGFLRIFPFITQLTPQSAAAALLSAAGQVHIQQLTHNREIG